MVRIRLVALGLVAVAVLSACSAEETSEPPPSDTATPTVSETPSEPAFEIHPVVGERLTAGFHTSSREALGNGVRKPIDEVGAKRAFEAIGTWLDGHLDDLQRGGDGDLVSVAPAGLVVAVEPDEQLPPAIQQQIAAVTTNLTNEELPVASARYNLAVYGEHTLEWATARVQVTRSDGSVARATFVFSLGENGTLSLMLAGPEEQADA